MLIHFICSGNTYRSRLAEAYLKSKQIQGIECISSGVEAEYNYNGPITWQAARILRDKELIQFMSNYWTQTTKELLDKSDLIIFVTDYQYNFCKEKLGYSGKNFEVWDIKDINDFGLMEGPNTLDEDIKIIQLSDQAFSILKQKIDELIEKLKVQTFEEIKT